MINWNEKLLEWFNERSNSNDGIVGCQLRDVLEKARELQDIYLLDNPEVEVIDLNAVWLYKWNLENGVLVRATQSLPEDVKIEDVFQYYVATLHEGFNLCRTNTDLQNCVENVAQANDENEVQVLKRVRRSCRAPRRHENPSTVTTEDGASKRRARSRRKDPCDKPSTRATKKSRTVFKPIEVKKPKKRVGKKPISCELDRQLWDWYVDRKSRGRKASVDIVRARARLMFTNAGHEGFKASESWYRKWLRRWKHLEVSGPKMSVPITIETGTNNDRCHQQADNLIYKDLTSDEMHGPSAATIHEIVKELESADHRHHHQVVEAEQHQHPLQKDDDIHVDSALDFMDVDFSLTSRLSDPTCLTSNFASCLDATEISGLTLPSVGGDDSRDLAAGVIMSGLNLTADVTLDLPEFLSVHPTPTMRNSHTNLHCGPTGGNSTIGGGIGDACKRKDGDRYQNDFKRQVIDYVAAYKKTFKKAAVEFGVHHSTVSQWCRDEQTAKDVDSIVRASNFNRLEVPDKLFIDWIRECRTAGLELDPEHVLARAKHLVEGHSEQDLEESCQWFVSWIKRWTKVSYDPAMEERMASGPAANKVSLLKYPEAFKVEVSGYAESRGNSWAARVFNVSRKRVSDWVASKDRVRRPAGRKVVSADAEQQIWDWYVCERALGRHPKGSDLREKAVHVFAAFGIPNIKCSSGWLKCWCNRFGVKLRNTSDDELLEWVLGQFEQNVTVSHADLQLHGASIVSTENLDFKASAGWSLRFCRRHPQLLRLVATVDAPLPEQLVGHVLGFRHWIRNVLQQNGLMLAAIGCMDEVPLSFDAAASSSHNHRKRPSLMRRTGFDNAAAVVCLTILADGGVLPPLVVIKGPHQDIAQREYFYPQDRHRVLFMEELGVTEDVLHKWTEEIWLRHVPSPALLILDGFKPHLALHSKLAVCSERGGHDVAIIPSGCSSKLQPLDVHLRTAFVDAVSDAYVRWTRSLLADAKKTVAPSAADILNFVTAGYRRVCQQQEIVRRSFVVTGITTTADGSQDHLVDDAAWAISDT